MQKQFDMKYVAGYHADNQFLNSLFLLVKVGSRNHVFQPLIFRPNSTLIFKSEKFDSLVALRDLKNVLGLTHDNGIPVSDCEVIGWRK
jgi:hypothetical protein